MNKNILYYDTVGTTKTAHALEDLEINVYRIHLYDI